MQKILLALLSIVLYGCAVGGEIRETARIDKAVGVVFEVGVGGEVYASRREKSLPNAFGRADVFGRTTPSGMTSVIFGGVENGGVVLFRRSTEIESGATTMNSTPIVIPNTYRSSHSGQVGGTRYSGTTTTQGPPIVIPANTPRAQYLDSGYTPIRVPLQDLPVSLPIEGRVVQILEANSYMAKVVIHEK